MNKKSSAKLVLLIVGICIVGCVLMTVSGVMLFNRLFYGKTDASRGRNKKWVQKMNDTYPDDEFTFVSYDRIGVVGLGSFKNKNAIILASKKYPDKKITVGWNDSHTKLVTDYNYVRFNEELNDYYRDILCRYLSPDEIDMAYRIDFVEKTELKDYSFDEYREEHKDDGKLSVYLKYVGTFPSEDEMIRVIESFLKDINSKVELTIHLSHDSVEPLQSTEGNERYVLDMESPTRISYLDHYVIRWHETKTHKPIRQDDKTTIYENKDLD